MDRDLVYSKTPFGEEATRQRTRVVQRNLRMVLLQVDGQQDVAGLIDRIGNEALVLAALAELEQGGFIAPLADAPQAGVKSPSPPASDPGYIEPRSAFEPSTLELAGQSQFSQFSSFGPPSIRGGATPALESVAAPVESPAVSVVLPAVVAEPEIRPSAPSLGERLRVWGANVLAGRGRSAGKRAPLLSWRNLSLALLAILGLLLFVAWPGERDRRQAEALLTRALAQPVKVADIELRLYPKPALLLRGVQVGAQIRADAVRLPWSVALSGSGRKSLGEVEVGGLNLPADALVGLPATLAGLKPGSVLEIARLRLSDVTFELAGMVWKDLEGSAEPDKSGKLVLSNFDRSLQLQVATEGAKTLLTVEALAWKPLADSPLFVQTLQARGTLAPGQLAFDAFDVNVLDGRMAGDIQLNWAQGLGLTARLQSERLNLTKLAAVFGLPLEIEGEVGGLLRLKGSGETPAALWRGLQAEMPATASKGRIHGVDLGEAARRAGEAVRGGMTRFDTLAARLQLAQGQLVLEALKLDAGLMHADGRLTVSSAGDVAGNLLLTVRSSVAPVRVPVRVEGRLPTLAASAAK